MPIIHSAALTAARSSIWHAQRRHLFRLPDLSSISSPFADSASIKPQTYHEQKVLPYVRTGKQPLYHFSLANSISIRSGIRAASCMRSSLMWARMPPSSPSAHAHASCVHSLPSPSTPTTIPSPHRVAHYRWRLNSPSLSSRSRSATRAE